MFSFPGQSQRPRYESGTVRTEVVGLESQVAYCTASKEMAKRWRQKRRQQILPGHEVGKIKNDKDGKTVD